MVLVLSLYQFKSQFPDNDNGKDCLDCHKREHVSCESQRKEGHDPDAGHYGQEPSVGIEDAQ